MSTATEAPSILDGMDLGDLLGGPVVVTAENSATPSVAPSVSTAVSTPATPKKAATARKVKQPFFFDIETVPDLSRLELFGLDPVPTHPEYKVASECPPSFGMLDQPITKLETALTEVAPDAEYLDWLESAEKIAPKPRKGVLDLIQATRDNRIKIDSAAAERNKLLSVTPEFNRIVAIGWAVGSDEVQSLTTGKQVDGTELSEGMLLDAFWENVKGLGPLVGYNVLGFDLPTIFIRSALRHVKPSRTLDLKPWGGEVIDLMQVRYPKGGSKRMKDLAKFYGFDVPAGETEGSQVMELYGDGTDLEKLAKLGEYVRSDVLVSRQMYQFYKGFFFA